MSSRISGLMGNIYRILDSASSAETYEYALELDPEHFIYKAHFPGNPITPGVCIMKMGVELASDAIGRKLRLSGARNVKFLQTIVPREGQVLHVSIRKVEIQGDVCLFQASVQEDDTVYARMSLICKIV